MPDELSLYAAMLDAPAGGRLGRLLEGMMTAQVTSAVARLGVADEFAGGPLAAAPAGLAGRGRGRGAGPAAGCGGGLRAGPPGQ